MNPLNSLRFTFHQKNWARCLLFNLANDCLLNWANSQKWQLFSLKLLFWVKIGVILWICLALQVVISFSAWEKSRDSTHRIFILEHKMRSLGHSKLFVFIFVNLWKIRTYNTLKPFLQRIAMPNRAEKGAGKTKTKAGFSCEVCCFSCYWLTKYATAVQVSSLSTNFGILKKSYYAKFVLVSTT